jgi:uncharacterized protein YjbI with pentapeptide repeats
MVIYGDITARELVARYKSGERDFSQLDLTDTPDHPLVGADLSGIILSEAFACCDFGGAILVGASFRDGNVKSSNFAEADLTNADFSGAALCGTTFKGAKLSGARFAGSYCYGYDMAEAELPSW